MNKSQREYKSLIWIILIGFAFNLGCGWIGITFDQGSRLQVLCYQIGCSFAISAAVMAARYTGLRGEQVTASAFILVGITHGISLSALSHSGMNVEREATMAMPMIPALIFMFWCGLFPVWLRSLSVVPCVLFLLVYLDVHAGEAEMGWKLYIGYGALQVIELLWGIYMYQDWSRNVRVQ